MSTDDGKPDHNDLGALIDGAPDLRRAADDAKDQYELGNVDEAMAAFAKIERASRASRNGLRLQEALMYQGIMRLQAGDAAAALAYFQEQESICRTLGLRPFLVMALGNQALALAKSEDPVQAERAVPLFEEVEGMAREEGDEGLLCRTMINKARLLWELDFDHARAAETYGEAIGLARRLGDGQLLALALGGRAESLGNDALDEIRDLCREALPLLEQFGPPFLLERVQRMLDYVEFLRRQ